MASTEASSSGEQNALERCREPAPGVDLGFPPRRPLDGPLVGRERDGGSAANEFGQALEFDNFERSLRSARPQASVIGRM